MWGSNDHTAKFSVVKETGKKVGELWSDKKSPEIQGNAGNAPYVPPWLNAPSAIPRSLAALSSN